MSTIGQLQIQSKTKYRTKILFFKKVPQQLQIYIAGRKPKISQQCAFCPKHLEMGPTKIFSGPLLYLSYLVMYTGPKKNNKLL